MISPEHRNTVTLLRTHPDLVYLDSAASSLTPDCVVDAMNEYYHVFRSNVHRGAYALSARATDAYEQTREAVAHFIGARESSEVVFVPSATYGLNMLASMIGATCRQGDVVVVGAGEHHANLVPWQQVALKRGIQCIIAPVTIDGIIDVAALEQILHNNRVKVVAIQHVSNVTGACNPIFNIARMVHTGGALLVVDGTQAVGHRTVSVQNMEADAYVFSGHKMSGPTGVGVMWARRELLSMWEPTLYGGAMIEHVTYDHATWNTVPQKFEPGTPPIAEVIGLGEAVKFLEQLNVESIAHHIALMSKRLYESLQSLEHVRMYTPLSAAGHGIVSFGVQGVHPHDIATWCDARHVCIRAGFHCAIPYVQALVGQGGTARASVYWYTRERDIQECTEAVDSCINFFHRS